jgi:hypothetical protein
VRRRLLLALVWLLLQAAFPARLPAQTPEPSAPVATIELRPTRHPPVPDHPDRFWLVPASTWQPESATARDAALVLGQAAALIAEDKPAQALPLIRPAALAATPLGPYARYFRGVAELKANRLDEARRSFATLRADQPSGALLERVLLDEADAAEAAGDDSSAMDLFDQLASPHVPA